MPTPFLDFVRIQQFACIRDCRLALTPIHAFVGPNDAGKSMILRAIGAAALRYGTVPNAPPPVPIQAQEAFALGFQDIVVWWRRETPHTTFLGTRDAPTSAVGSAPAEVKDRLSGATFLKLQASDLRQPAALIPSHTPTRFASPHGAGLPAVLDAIAGRNLTGWVALRNEFHARFPTVKSLELLNVNGQMKAIGTVLHSGVQVGVQEMSEGQLFWLAFAALRHQPDPPSMVLIEEPETGLHPARIAEVMAVLREVADAGTQVLLTTHSPLVLNALSGDEITVVTRTEADGTQGTRLCDTPNYAERSGVYHNGELWVSYADGVAEAALLLGGPRP